MTITMRMIKKIIRIGENGKGIYLEANECKALDLEFGTRVELTLHKSSDIQLPKVAEKANTTTSEVKGLPPVKPTSANQPKPQPASSGVEDSPQTPNHRLGSFKIN